MTALADSLRTRTIALGKSLLTAQSQWYYKGTFKNPTNAQWVYNTSGPAILCAGLYRAGGFVGADTKYLSVCLESFNYSIDNLLDGGGKFIDEPASGSADLEVFVYASGLAWAMYLLDTHLDAATRSKWMTALKSNIDWLETSNNLLYWANGNWVVNGIRMLFHAKELCRSSGDSAGYAKYEALYERQIAFLQSPVATDPKWAGYGINIDTQGTQADWSDTIAHLTELNGGPPIPNAGAGTSSDGMAPFSTFDGDYTALSLEHIAIWYASSRDYRALKILNAVANKFFSLVDTTHWTASFGHGSRHNIPTFGVFTPSLAVLTLLGERLVSGSLAVPFTSTMVLDNWDNSMIGILSTTIVPGAVPIGFLRSWGNIIPAILLACEQQSQALL